MPEKTGIRLYEELKTNPEQANIPVVVISAFQPELQKFLGRRLKVPPPESYLFKPLAVEELLAAIENVLSSVAIPRNGQSLSSGIGGKR